MEKLKITASAKLCAQAKLDNCYSCDIIRLKGFPVFFFQKIGKGVGHLAASQGC